MKAVLVAILGLCVGCTVGEVASEKTATATLESKSGSTVTGSAKFTATGTMVSLKLTVSGASAGMHGVHLHVTGDCSAVDAATAGGHWDPPMGMHGLPGSAQHHLGDAGNFAVATDGTGTLNFTGAWSLGTGEMNDVVGHSVIVHANMDDGTTPPMGTGMGPGNSGARQACGVILAD